MGAPVVSAVSQASGYSPGSADRLRLADGRRVFVKAVSAEVNPDSIAIHRREADDVLPYDLDTNDWVANPLGLLADQAAEGLRRCDGTALVHGDLRADNLLLRQDGGQAVVLDWPWAQVGSAWFDPVSLLVDVLYRRPGFDIDALVATHRLFADMPGGTVECLFAGLAAYFTVQAIQPAPAGIVGLRAFQRDQGAVTLRWLRLGLDRVPRSAGTPRGW